MIKFALVTSSTRGIGKSIGIELLNKGYYVFFNYVNNDEDAYKLKQELVRFDGKYSIIKTDLSNLDGVDVIYDDIIKITNNLDCIVLNTGVTNYKSFKDLTPDDWNKVINTNLNVPFFLIQKLSDNIVYDGRIIFIGAILGLIPHGISIPYSVSKAGLTILAKSLVKYFKNKNITVNVIAPGFIDTSWQLLKDKDHRKRIENKIALNRFGYPEEVAKTCMHIIDNQYINGAVICVDGGYDME
jgi:3-oxoacyl-[acyl-carrier protein] reductase